MHNTLRNTLLGSVWVILAFVCTSVIQAGDTSNQFTVVEGASPWFDRVGQWVLANVPDSLKGSGPLPQGDCSSRSLEVPGKPVSILVGVQANDAAKVTAMFPAAKDTGLQIAVRDPQGNTLPYTIFSLTHPPAKIEGTGVFGAGLLLLKVEDGKTGPAASPATSSRPATSPHAMLVPFRPFESC